MNKIFSFFNNLSLLKKVLLVPICSMFLAIIMIGINHYSSKSIASNTKLLYTKYIPVLEQSTNNSLILNQIAENLTTAVLSSELKIIEQTKNQAEIIKQNLKSIKEELPDIKNIDKIEKSFDEYYATSLSISQKLILNNLLIENEDSLKLSENFTITKQSFEDLTSKIKNSIKNNFDTIEYTSSIIINNQLYTIVLTYIVLFFLSFLIYKNINKKFETLLKNIINLSKSSLDDKKRIEKTSNDELGVLSNSLNKILEDYQNSFKILSDEKVEYFNLSHKDKLTGLFNRYYLDRVLEEHDSKKESISYGIIMIDIDNFKKINDTFGHQIGDEVLKTLSEILKQHTRKNDIVGRWGGEEFLCIVDTNSKGNLLLIAENLRKHIEKKHIDLVKNITVSCGCALNNGNSSKLVIENADKALYEAKNSGKNRVNFANY